MASLMENLIDILEKEIAEYGTLLELSERKTPVIVKGELPVLQKITDDEQDVVGRLAHLERKRDEVMDDIANVLNKDVDTLKLHVLIQILEGRPAEQQRLAKARDGLKEVVDAISRINEQNQALIQQQLDMVEFDLNIIRSMNSAPVTADYDRTAAISGGIMGNAAGKFDAKQ